MSGSRFTPSLDFLTLLEDSKPTRKECDVKDRFGGFGTPGGFRVARRRCDRASRQEGLPRQDRVPVLWRARREPVRLEGTGCVIGLRQGRAQGRGRTRRSRTWRRNRVL